VTREGVISIISSFQARIPFSFVSFAYYRDGVFGSECACYRVMGTHARFSRGGLRIIKSHDGELGCHGFIRVNWGGRVAALVGDAHQDVYPLVTVFLFFFFFFFFF